VLDTLAVATYHAQTQLLIVDDAPHSMR
jgi:hypothetical protein